jgi:hypothetical protein
MQTFCLAQPPPVVSSFKGNPNKGVELLRSTSRKSVLSFNNNKNELFAQTI